MGSCIKSEHETVGTPTEYNRQLTKKNTIHECEMAMGVQGQHKQPFSTTVVCYTATLKHTRGTQQ